MTETLFIGGLHKAWAKLSMYLNRSADDLLG